MAHENLGYAMLCTDAYIIDVHECDYDTSLYFFDITLPSGDLLRLDFTHMQIHWTASFLFSLPPYRSPCTI